MSANQTTSPLPTARTWRANTPTSCGKCSGWREKGEVLISVSGDGRVIEWTIKKGLEFTELMQLKRETNPN